MSTVDQLKKKVGAKPKGKIELFSPEYFAACTLGGIIGMSISVILFTLLSKLEVFHLVSLIPSFKYSNTAALSHLNTCSLAPTTHHTFSPTYKANNLPLNSMRSNTYRCYTPRSSKDSPSSRSQTLHLQLRRMENHIPR
jgi:hypothetical protein